MGELSFLTIIVSLAVSALLVYAVFQYMKVRLTILEQSHKEQAMILQQFIEESSTDIHRLYQISSSSTNGGSVATNGSIILEYANDNKPAAYNEPHMIHLDTALFQNKRNSNLIEISSDSEDTTDESEEHENSSSDDDDHSENSEDDNEAEGSDSDDSQAEEDGAHGADAACDSFVVNDDECNHVPVISENVSSPEIKLITVDLGITQESEIKFPITVEEMPVEAAAEAAAEAEAPAPPPAPAEIDVEAQALPPAEAPPGSVSSSSIPLTNMSVPDLKQLLKEKYKNQPEKHPEIQKLKKAELIYALQHSQ